MCLASVAARARGSYIFGLASARVGSCPLWSNIFSSCLLERFCRGPGTIRQSQGSRRRPAAHPPPPHLWPGSACPPSSPLPLLSLAGRVLRSWLSSRVPCHETAIRVAAQHADMERAWSRSTRLRPPKRPPGQFRRRSTCNALTHQPLQARGAPQSSSPPPSQDARLPLSLPTPSLGGYP